MERGRLIAVLNSASYCNYLSHIFLGCEDELVVDHPARPLLEQAAVGVGGDRLLVLDRLVRATLTQAHRVVEETRRDGLAKER